MKSFSILSVLLAATAASAHTIFQQIGINGVMQTRHQYMRLPSYDGPITDVTATEMACNGGPNPLVKISSDVASVPAGAQITLQWGQTLDSDFDTGLIIDASHKGPVMVYMSKVSSATGAIPNSGWFKIYEDGYTNGVWGVDKLITNKGKVTVTLPSCLPAGDYLLRGELIALHAAGSYPGAQLYMECAQIRLTSGGSTSPATYNIPGIYAGTDAGIKFNLYASTISYTIPGPRPFTC
ncbi:glycoside hydrolase [Tricharina praecox]|uniref:glycoside hydrolase n=1 Tax=Tricharina praecox TaxID=43433 RepID=UPI00221E6BDB|nr:glycoside hydrolase [Tricharina praecox]KAI5853761.1 glycoside hydrolase [Tricharina praecox]